MAKTVRFKCPFCEKRFTREDLVVHVEEEHEDLIPEEFTPLRYVFNYVNKKPLEYHGKCTECGGPTPWDENKGRYNRQCTNPRCKESFIKKFESNMIRTNGVTRISSTIEGQEKMLANRKISGTYKFKNGKEKTYTGNYELKALQFMDTVMNIDPDDILAPGPAIEYECDGVKHFYISDFYYIPYNLIIEVKDGGNRPNKRDMPEYRKKQIAKEKQIIKNTRYNYLRLTDNDFSQLLSVFMDLKMQLVDETQKRVIHINEASNKFRLSNYRYENIKSKNDVDLFKKYSNEIFNENNNMSDKDIYNQIKKIYYKNIFIGYIGLVDYYSKVNNKHYLGIRSFMILPKYQRKGHGSSIINDIIEENKSKYDEIYCWVLKDNQNAINFYSKITTINPAETKKDCYYVSLYKNQGLYESINEAMNALMSGYIPGADCKDSVFIVNYMQNNVFSGEEIRGYCISDDYKLENIIARNKEGILEHAPSNFLDNARYDVYMIKDVKESVVKKLAENMHKFVDESFIYESVFGHSMYTYDQIMLEESAIPVLDFNRAMELIGESTKNVLLGKSVCESMIISGTNASEIYNNFGIMESCFAIDENNISDPLERRFLEGLYYKEE